jgi:hypothetical protein
MSAEDALRAESLPNRGLIGRQGFKSFCTFLDKLGGIGIVNRDAFRGAQVCFGWRRNGWRPAGFGSFPDGAHTFDQFCRGRGADQQRSAEGCFGLCRRMAHAGCAGRAFGRRSLTDHHRMLAVSGEPVRNVFLQHRMEIRAAESERTDSGAPYAIHRLLPRVQFPIHVERRVLEIDVGIGVLAANAWRQHLVAEGERHL